MRSNPGKPKTLAPEPQTATRQLKDQVVHLTYNALFFVVIAALAIGLDLASSWVKTIGVTHFTSNLLEYTSHILFGFDLVLFFLSLLASGWHFVRGIRP